MRIVHTTYIVVVVFVTLRVIMPSHQFLKNIMGSWHKLGDVIMGPRPRAVVLGSSNRIRTMTDSYFTQKILFQHPNTKLGGLAITNRDVLTLLRNHNSYHTWNTLYSRLSGSNGRSNSGNFGERPSSSSAKRKRKFYICLATITATLTVFLEYNWLRRKLSELVPENPALVGEKLPSQYIYCPTDNLVKSWLDRKMPWMACCNSPAWKYVTMTKSSDIRTKEEGIQKLIELRDLSDMEFHIVASALDFKTAVAIAHGGGDPRLVKLGRTLHPDKKNMCLATKFREIFGALPESSIHTAVHEACFTALQCFKPTPDEAHNRYLDVTAGFESEFVASPLKYSSEPDFLKPCLQGLLSHCRLHHQIPAILDLGTMDLLLVISRKYRKDIAIMGLVAKIFASIACHPYSDEKFESADVLGLIADLALENDVRLSFPARKTLHNLDRDSVHYILPPGIYQFYPEVRSNENDAVVDVVFVHGILGGAFRTWRSQDLRAIWRFTRVDSSNHYSLCETNPVSWFERHSARDGTTASFPTFKDPVKLTEENSEDYYKPEPTISNLIISVKGYPNDIVISRTSMVEPPPRNRELRDGKMYYFPPYEEIPLEGDNVLLDPPKSQCWPGDWLPLDIPNLRILAADFDTFITNWTPVLPVESVGRTIDERSKELLERFARAGVGHRPVVWVVHSAGGILTKKLLELCEQSEREDYRQIAVNTKAVVFCSTPHIGSKLAGIGNKGQKVMLPTVEVSEMSADSAELKQINENFKSLMKKYKFRVTSFGELCSTAGSLGVKAKLVTIDSADPGYGEFYGLKVDHLNICKPRSRESFLYRKITQVIGEVVQKEQAGKTKVDDNQEEQPEIKLPSKEEKDKERNNNEPSETEVP